MNTIQTSARSPRAEKSPARDYLSHSAINTYRACPLKYEFRYIRGLPEETITSSLAFGSAFHASVQRFFEQLRIGSPPPGHDILLDVFWDAWKQNQGRAIHFAGGETLDTIGQLADRTLRAFQASALAKPPGTIIGVEEELRGELIPGLPDLLARVDLIVETADALVVTDFKTARRSWSNNQVTDAASQLLLYHELVKTLSDGKPLRLQFAVMPKTKTPELALHTVAPSPSRIERSKRIVERVWHAIQFGQVYPNSSPSNCSSCPFKLPCQAWNG